MLYELVLSIGRSLDLSENINSFMKTFMTRKNYEVGAVYLKQKRKSQPAYKLVLAHPEVRVPTKNIGANHKLVQMLEENPGLAISSTEENFDALITESGVIEGEFLVFRLK